MTQLPYGARVYQNLRSLLGALRALLWKMHFDARLHCGPIIRVFSLSPLWSPLALQALPTVAGAFRPHERGKDVAGGA
jgi:hypothetical protein